MILGGCEQPSFTRSASACAAALLGEAFDTAGWVRPEELALLERGAVESRRREFCLGRAAARLALLRAGESHAGAILEGTGGQPLWPRGWVGSITHTCATAAAVVAPVSRAAGVGVDIEDLSREAGAGVADAISLPSELAWIGSGPDADLRTKMVFSAKESAFKAFFPLAGVLLGFKDAELRWDGGRFVFSATLLRAASPAHPAGFSFEVAVRVAAQRVVACVLLEEVAEDRRLRGGAALAAVDWLAAALA